MNDGKLTRAQREALARSSVSYSAPRLELRITCDDLATLDAIYGFINSHHVAALARNTPGASSARDVERN